MRRALTLVMVLVVFTACHRAASGPMTGATSSDAAVQQFLFAAKAQDLQALSAVWGNEESPVRDRADRQELERRLLIMVCHLRHDESRIGPAQAGEGGRVMHRVDLTQGTKTAAPIFTTVRNRKSGRWFVETFDMTAVSGFCSGGVPSAQRPPDEVVAAR